MTNSEMLMIVGSLIGTYLLGWALGYTILFFKQLSEKI